MNALKIISLQAENIKKLVAVEIRPDGNLVQITGKNGQGKTSILDCIWWALAGAGNVQAAPIRKGQEKAVIRLDLGEIIITRTFQATGEGGQAHTTSIIVENADGARFPSPQKMLDGLLGQLSFDPLAFARMDPKARFDLLRTFVPGVDFKAIEAAHQADYAARTDLNRRIKDARSMAEGITVPAEAPTERINETALIEELETAGKTNLKIGSLMAERESQVKFEKDSRDRAEYLVTKGKQVAEEILRKAKEEAEKLQIDCKRESDQLIEKADKIKADLDAAPPIPAGVDTNAVKEKIEAAKQVNRIVALIEAKAGHERKVKEFQENVASIESRMAERQADKVAKIAAAKLPVEGISFGDHGAVLIGGVPFEQLSDAEQLRISLSFAMTLNPKLRVIRVRDGSLLDEDSMKLVAAMAQDKDYQVWIERVDSSGKIGFVIEDGHIKGQEQEVGAA